MYLSIYYMYLSIMCIYLWKICLDVYELLISEQFNLLNVSIRTECITNDTIFMIIISTKLAVLSSIAVVTIKRIFLLNCIYREVAFIRVNHRISLCLVNNQSFIIIIFCYTHILNWFTCIHFFKIQFYFVLDYASINAFLYKASYIAYITECNISILII